MPRSILVVDDDHPIADVLANLLTDEGYDVRCAYDGQAALEAVQRGKVDLVVSDVMMPKVDGLTLTNRLRERGNPTPVVLMSAVYADVDVPGIRFVPKPFDLDDIVQVVERIFDEMEICDDR